MIKFFKENAGMVALVILAIMGIMFMVKGTKTNQFGTAVDCNAVTCFTTVGILTSLQVDGTTIFNAAFRALSTLQIGSSGTAFTQVVGSTCNLIGTDTSQTASTTKAYDCAVTGVTSSDKVLAMLASSTPVGGSVGWSISAAKASTTAGYVTVLLYNNGVAAIPSVTSVGSSTVVMAFH